MALTLGYYCEVIDLETLGTSMGQVHVHPMPAIRRKQRPLCLESPLRYLTLITLKVTGFKMAEKQWSINDMASLIITFIVGSQLKIIQCSYP